MFFLVIRDKHRIKLPFIQILTCMLFCPGLTAGISGRYQMIYCSLRSLSPALTLWLLLGFASPPNIFLWNSTGGTYQMDEDWTDVFAENQ